jgi:competence protein ComEC
LTTQGAQIGGVAGPRAGIAPAALGLAAWLADQIEAQGERWRLWTPVAFGLGAASYFALPREPLAFAAWIALAVAFAAAAGALALGGRKRGVALALAAFLSAGFAVAKLRVEAVKAPVALASAKPQRLEGWVLDVASPGQGGQRLLIATRRIEGWAPRATPIRLRVTLREGAPIPPPGAPIRLLAILNPPPPPASPGAYDFARDAYFDSVGGVGLALGAPQAWTPDEAPPWRLRLAMKVNAVRWALTERIVRTLGRETGGLAAAMTTGQQAFVPREQVDDLRAAGLAHIISISGVHMAIVGGFTFAGLRLLIAAWPWLALRIDGKKAAAACALGAVLVYLALSGAPPPAERAAITAAAAFCAILVDRQAISLHALALAALAILLLQPEAVIQPGFQMSFAATAALVALAGGWPRPVREIAVPWPIRAAQAIRTGVLAGAAISLVAGLATAPIAMQNFNRVATWGLICNLLVEPISTLLMMPGLALGAALTPLGLGDIPLQVAGFAIGLMNRIAHTAAQAPFAQLVVASGPAWTLPTAFLGMLWLCLWRGPLRWLGLPAALAVSLAPKPPVPAIWIAADGAAVALRHGSQAVLLRPDVKRFGAELWARRRGLEPQETAAPRDALLECDRWSCAPRPGAPVALGAAWNLRRPLAEGRLDEICARSEVVVLRNDVPRERCPAPLLITGADIRRGGSAELYRQLGGGWRIVWAEDLRGRRPWTWGLDLR